MRTAVIIALFLVASPSSAAECLLTVMAKTYIDGPCEFRPLENGNFALSANPDGSAGPMRFAYVYVDGDPAYGFWNGDPAENHAHRPLGDLTRDGACWHNQEARVCAYK